MKILAVHKNRALVAALGCVVCRVKGYEDTPCEIHHLRSGAGMGQKSDRIIGLCPLHHRTGPHGVAYHSGRRAFERAFGEEVQLHAMTEELLNETGDIADADKSWDSCCEFMAKKIREAGNE